VRARREFSVQLEAYAHATEDPERIEEAVRKCVPLEVFGRLRPSVRRVEGYFGNPIVIMTWEATGEDLPEMILGHLARGLMPSDRERLSRHFERYIDEKGVLLLRLDKQRAYMDELTLGSADAILIRARTKPRGRTDSLKEIRSIARKAGLIT